MAWAPEALLGSPVSQSSWGGSMSLTASLHQKPARPGLGLRTPRPMCTEGKSLYADPPMPEVWPLWDRICRPWCCSSESCQKSWPSPEGGRGQGGQEAQDSGAGGAPSGL